MNSARILLLIGFAGAFAGCMPFVTPPVRMSAAYGGQPGLRADREGPSGLWNLRASLHPADLVPQAHLNAVDFGVGYTVDKHSLFDSPFYSRGAFAEIGYYPWIKPLDRVAAARFGPFVTVDRLWTDEDHPRSGWGMSTGVAFEINGFAKGCASDNREVLACAYGLMGLRIFAILETRQIDEMRYMAPMFGFGWRLPAAVGIVGLGRNH